MPVDAIGPAGNFAVLSVGDTRITPSGATISIVDQKIEVTDMTAFLAFLKVVMQDEKCELSLFAKAATIKALMIRRTIEFSKPAEVIGWKSLKAKFVNFKPDKIVLKIESPSQTSIDFGDAVFEIQDRKGLVLAKLTGELKVEKGENFHELDLVMAPGLESKGEVGDVLRLVGIDVVETSWLKEAIKFFDIDLVVSKEWVDAVKQL
jgi:hypothetical protein